MGPENIFDIFEHSQGWHDSDVPICNYWGLYNTLLSRLFLEDPFMITMDETYMTVALRTRHIYPPKPVLFFLILAVASWNDSIALKGAEDTMKNLLIGADAPAVPMVHGVCVSGSRVAFYCYNRQLEMFMPERGQVHFNHNLKEDDGAARMLGC